MKNLRDFREAFPQYAHFDDDQLAANIHETWYADRMSLEQVRANLGLPDLDADPEPEPIASQIDQKLTTRADPLKPAPAEETPGFVSNVVRGAGERLGDVIGGVFTAASELTETMGRGAEEELARLTTDEGLERDIAVNFARNRPNYFGVLGERLKDWDFGYVERNTTQNVKDAYAEGGVLGAADEAIAFGAEQGLKSVPDMVAAVYTLPQYLLSRSGEIGEERARNKGKDEVDEIDILEAAPFAIGSALLERFGAKGVGSAGSNISAEAAETVGKEVLQAGYRTMAEGSKAGAKEAGTEFFQEGVIEYVGERFGTDASLVLADAMERGAFGALAGGVTGGGLGTTAAGGREVLRGLDRQLAQSDPLAEFDDMAPARRPHREYAGPANDPMFDEFGPEDPTFGDDVDADPEPVPDGEAERPDYFDPRLKRQGFRDELAQMSQDLKRKAEHMGFVEISDRYGKIEKVYRTPSENPEWYKEGLAPELPGLSVAYVQKTVQKAIEGKRLRGERQQFVIKWMLDEITYHREDYNNLVAARKKLEASRDQRRAERLEREGGYAGVIPIELYDQLGTVFEEGEYLEGMDFDGRAIFELSNALAEAGRDPYLLFDFDYENDAALIAALEDELEAALSETNEGTTDEQQTAATGGEATRAEPPAEAPATETPAAEPAAEPVELEADPIGDLQPIDDLRKLTPEELAPGQQLADELLQQPYGKASPAIEWDIAFDPLSALASTLGRDVDPAALPVAERVIYERSQATMAERGVPETFDVYLVNGEGVDSANFVAVSRSPENSYSPDQVYTIAREDVLLDVHGQYGTDPDAEFLISKGMLERFRDDGIGSFAGYFDPPYAGRFRAPAHTVRAANLVGDEELSQADADARIEEWKAEAKRIGRDEDRSNQVILSLFDASGVWSQPYRDAGYTVVQFDMKLDDDLMEVNPYGTVSDLEAEGKQVVGILSAPPCTCFANSGARWHRTHHEKPDTERVNSMFGNRAARYFSRPVEYNMAMAAIVDLWVDASNPEWFVLENPEGQLKKRTGMPKHTMSFQPHHFGDPYTKITQLFGEFNPILPTANVDPVEGSKIHQLTSRDEAERGARSQTPEGFAYAFFMANHAEPQESAAMDPIKPAERQTLDSQTAVIDSVTLVDVLPADSDLLRAYPQLADVKLTPTAPRSVGAQYDPTTRTIEYRAGAVDGRTLAHEIQHAIQQVRGESMRYEGEAGALYQLGVNTIERTPAFKKAYDELAGYLLDNGMDPDAIPSIEGLELYDTVYEAIDDFAYQAGQALPQEALPALEDVYQTFSDELEAAWTQWSDRQAEVPQEIEAMQAEEKYGYTLDDVARSLPTGKGASTQALKATQNAGPGSNYVPLIGHTGALPLDPNHAYQLGNGRTVRIPKNTLRKKHIIRRIERQFGTKIYQGRVKGKTRLGFYRKRIGEIRTKFRNDLEVTAHEFSHWLDDRFPWIERLYKDPRFADEVKGVSYTDDPELASSEGFAEFMRLWFTDEAKARQAAPNFYDAWMLEADRKGLLDQIADTQELMHAWYLQGARQRLASKIGDDQLPLRERVTRYIQDAPDKILTNVFDDLRPFKQAERAIAGGELDATESGYKAFRLARGGVGVIEAIMHKGTITENADGDIEFNGKGLLDVFAPVEGQMDEFQLYMVARRAAELRSQGRENLIRPDEIASGLALAQEHPHFADVFDEWIEFNDRMLDYYQQQGLLSSQARDAIYQMNRNYVPFNRIMDSAESVFAGGTKVQSKGGSPFVRLKGGTGNIGDVFENIVTNMAHLTQMALINKGKQNFYDMVDRADDQTSGMYAVRIPTDVKPVGIDRDQVIKAFVEGLGISMAEYRRMKALPQDAGETFLVTLVEGSAAGLEPFVTFYQPKQAPQGDVDSVFRNGERVYYEVGDPVLLEAIGHLGPQAHNLAVNILGGFANVLRRGVTLTPTFQAKNFIRDTFNAWTLSRGRTIPAGGAIKALIERIYTDEHYWEYMANGGGFSSLAEADGINRDKIVDNVGSLAATFDRGFLSAFELANRISEFKALRAKGYSKREAAFLGREISSDFAMRGASDALRVITISVPFLNARLQGLYRLAREVGQLPPGQDTADFLGRQAFSYALRGLIGITVPSIALYLLNKDDERYQEMPEWVKDLSWVIFTGDGEDDYVLIPKPFETGMLFGTLPERMLELVETGDGVEFANAIGWMFMETFAMDPTAQAVKPIVELATNENFTGAPIVPEYLEDVANAEQYRAYTSDSMIALGRALNVSPLQAEHLVKGYLGTLGTWALGLSDYMVRAAYGGDLSGGGDAPAKNLWRENVLLEPFINTGPLRRTKSETDFYDLLKMTREVVETVRLMEDRSPERLLDYLDDGERQALFAINAASERVSRETRALNNAADAVRANPQMPAEQKRAHLDDIQRAKNQLMREWRMAIDQRTVRDIGERLESANAQ